MRLVPQESCIDVWSYAAASATAASLAAFFSSHHVRSSYCAEGPHVAEWLQVSSLICRVRAEARRSLCWRFHAKTKGMGMIEQWEANMRAM